MPSKEEAENEIVEKMQKSDIVNPVDNQTKSHFEQEFLCSKRRFFFRQKEAISYINIDIIRHALTCKLAVTSSRSVHFVHRSNCI